MNKEPEWTHTVSPENNKFARIAQRLVGAAVRLHGTICISFLTEKEIEEALNDQAEQET